MTTPAWNRGLKKGCGSLLHFYKSGRWFCCDCWKTIAWGDIGGEFLEQHAMRHRWEKHGDTHVFFGRTMVPRTAFKAGSLYNPDGL